MESFHPLYELFFQHKANLPDIQFMASGKKLPLFAEKEHSSSSPMTLHQVTDLNKTLIGLISRNIHLMYIPDRIAHGNVCFATENEHLQEAYRLYFDYQDLLHYAYAFIHTVAGQQLNVMYLTNQYILVDLPKSEQQFWYFQKMGKSLRLLHTLSNIDIDMASIHFGSDDSGIKKLTCQESENGWRLYIDKNTNFATIPKEVWNFTIFGYNPVQTQIENRKGHDLTKDEMIMIVKIITSVEKTIDLIRLMDSLNGPIANKNP